MGLLDLLVHKLLESGLYIHGYTAIVIHFQMVTNFVLFQFQISIQLVQELLKAFPCAVVTLLKFTMIQAKLGLGMQL
jgi:hypothetical protein